MITHNGNKTQSNSNVNGCFPGQLVQGQTIDGNGTLKNIAIDANGRVLTITNASGTPIDTSNAFFNINPVQVTIPVGLKAIGTLLAYEEILVLVQQDGLYRINPNIMLDANATGSVSFVLIENASAIDTYTQGLVRGVDAWAPAAAIFSQGIVAMWHNISLNAIGTGAFKFTVPNNTQEKLCFLESNSYYLAAIVDTAIIINGTIHYLSLNSIETVYTTEI